MENLIVVGVDGSPGGRRALEWAIAEAGRIGGAVQAVTAWTWDGIESGPLTATSPAAQRQCAETLLRDEIDAVLRQVHEPVTVTGEVSRNSPVDALTAAAEKAGLLVLGSHGHSALRHRVLGSVSDGCIRHARCPVVVVPTNPAA
ncbi:universal stress protein [Catenuloplanes atrovinosus]|uniref:Nucleotide-binding universal stress UspA family protein n=1 Tax=Catenuloplanes atrovinosus TaxID=137266 RepID=A0AAE3YPZ8_9ACTN|nr:universal stress protein [Catenuloplanes atrovinosus]MDR7275676.1 nucleotide-binding universal stress UspA family protein [Catenuloplanes atrovinosus]